MIEKIIKEMKELSEILIPYTFPIVDFSAEQEILLLKQRNIIIDGNDILVCYS